MSLTPLSGCYRVAHSCERFNTPFNFASYVVWHSAPTIATATIQRALPNERTRKFHKTSIVVSAAKVGHDVFACFGSITQPHTICPPQPKTPLIEAKTDLPIQQKQAKLQTPDPDIHDIPTEKPTTPSTVPARQQAKAKTKKKLNKKKTDDPFQQALTNKRGTVPTRNRRTHGQRNPKATAR
jgi:hypothetical protein